MKKIITLGAIALFLIQPINTFASDHTHTIEPNQYNVSETNTGLVEPRKDITGWRYKSIGGQIHKRLYNYSKEAWIGPWIPC